MSSVDALFKVRETYNTSRLFWQVKKKCTVIWFHCAHGWTKKNRREQFLREDNDRQWEKNVNLVKKFPVDCG